MITQAKEKDNVTSIYLLFQIVQSVIKIPTGETHVI